MRKVLIAGAAGRDFHNFNVAFRGRDDVRVVVIENDGRPAGFFPHQRAAWGRGGPVGGAPQRFRAAFRIGGCAGVGHGLDRTRDSPDKRADDRPGRNLVELVGIGGLQVARDLPLRV